VDALEPAIGPFDVPRSRSEEPCEPAHRRRRGIGLSLHVVEEPTLAQVGEQPGETTRPAQAEAPFGFRDELWQGAVAAQELKESGLVVAHADEIAFLEILQHVAPLTFARREARQGPARPQAMAEPERGSRARGVAL